MRNRQFKGGPLAFTLIEVMIAVLFISIGFFGYVALHSRLLYSGQRLEAREVIRSGTDFFESLETTRAHLGYPRSIDGQQYEKDQFVPELVKVSTRTEFRDMSWLSNYHEDYRLGVDKSIELELWVYQTPYRRRWNKR